MRNVQDVRGRRLGAVVMTLLVAAACVQGTCAFSIVTPPCVTYGSMGVTFTKPTKTTTRTMPISSLQKQQSQQHSQPRLFATVPVEQDAASSVLANEQMEEVMMEEEVVLFQHTDLGKAVNLAILLASFGFALHTILDIDHGMTRGWTQSEIALRIPVDTWSSYENSLSQKPIATKTTINVIIYLLGDWLSQTLFNGKSVLDFDASRTLRNGFIGLCFGPLVHEYYEFSDRILPLDGEGNMMNRVYKILMDQTLYLSVKCSVYIMAVGVLGGQSLEDATQNVKDRIAPIMFTAWKFWPLVHCVTYGLIPARHRILWVNSVDLIWNAILASKTSSDDPITPISDTPEEEEEEQQRQLALMSTDGTDHADEKEHHPHHATTIHELLNEGDAVVEHVVAEISHALHLDHTNNTMIQGDVDDTNNGSPSSETSTTRSHEDTNHLTPTTAFQENIRDNNDETPNDSRMS
eukprot:CAMPEP_0198282202 /NCGR_PEP_ID=MMETSP1449-20131203/2051_1 /TAXON_ID=420275 /ORGANISM="Attheya septentrionalis, Strain CCMP2084" /LENGTH=463 /DNA_ID=CAMNT_0043978357 /DNA_START=182 /DNA_END=1573 /DNA_ORIENTATION=-